MGEHTVNGLHDDHRDIQRDGDRERALVARRIGHGVMMAVAAVPMTAMAMIIVAMARVTMGAMIVVVILPGACCAHISYFPVFLKNRPDPWPESRW